MSVDDVGLVSSTNCCQLRPASNNREIDVRFISLELDNDGRSSPVSNQTFSTLDYARQLVSCLIYARELLEYVNFIVWVRSVSKMLPSVKFAEYKVLTFLILR